MLFREQNKIREKNAINIQHVAKQQPCSYIQIIAVGVGMGNLVQIHMNIFIEYGHIHFIMQMSLGELSFCDVYLKILISLHLHKSQTISPFPPISLMFCASG